MCKSSAELNWSLLFAKLPSNILKHHRPVRIRQNIRDLIDSPTAPLSLKTAELQTTLGYPISFDPEWGMLWKTLKPFFSENSTFIPYVAKVLTIWCDVFGAWLEDSENEEVVEKLLDGLKGRGKVELVLEVYIPYYPLFTIEVRELIYLTTRSHLIQPDQRPTGAQINPSSSLDSRNQIPRNLLQ